MTPLHQIGDFLRNWLLLVPLPAVRALFVVTLAIVLIWVWRLPRAATTPAGGARHWDENLKVGATAALVVQIVIYSLF